MNWSYFDKFKKVNDKYLPDMGEGETMATQACTAINKLVYKWYNDGDVYDNTYYMSGWCNNLSTYANWLYEYIPQSRDILLTIVNCYTEEDYENILVKLANNFLTFDVLNKLNNWPKIDSIYKCEGVFKWEEQYDDEDEDY